jgi:hypothetical protein
MMAPTAPNVAPQINAMMRIAIKFSAA